MSDSESKAEVGGGGPRVRPPRNESKRLASIEARIRRNREQPHEWAMLNDGHLLCDDAEWLLAQLADLRGDREAIRGLCTKAGMMEDSTARDYLRGVFYHLKQVMAERDTLQQQLDEFKSGLRKEMATVGMDLLAGEWEARAKKAETDLAALRSRGQALVEQLEKLTRYDPAVGLGGVPMGHLPASDGEWVLWKDVRACADALTAILQDHQP